MIGFLTTQNNKFTWGSGIPGIPCSIMAEVAWRAHLLTINECGLDIRVSYVSPWALCSSLAFSAANVAVSEAYALAMLVRVGFGLNWNR